MLEAVAGHQPGRGLEHHYIAPLQQLGRAIPGDHHAQAQRQRAMARRHAGQAQHRQHAAALYQRPGQQVAAMQPDQHRGHGGDQHGHRGTHGHAVGNARLQRQPQHAGKGHGHAQPVAGQGGIVGCPVVDGRTYGRTRQPREEQRGQPAQGRRQRLAAPVQQQARARHGGPGKAQVAEHIQRMGQRPPGALVGKRVKVLRLRHGGAKPGGQQQQGSTPVQRAQGGGR